ncbi:acid phosphatase pho5 [Ascosphaera pollenicola]|nr:acid phosphatase pho5 [Ascosphaera pollenicola]
MVRRNLALAFVSTLVASGAWYYSTKGVDTTPAAGSSEATSAATTRRALVVENGQFYTGTIEGDGPLQKQSDDHRYIHEMLTPEQATQKLRRNEESYHIGRGNGVVRYDIVQVPSNNPIEDDHVEEIIHVSDGSLPSSESTKARDWMFWGIFDGHSGWTTSAKLRQSLVSYVVQELNSTYKSATSMPSALPSPGAVDEAIKRGFLRLDNDIVHESVKKTLKANTKLAAAELLAPALSGSCALLAFYDTSSNLLKIACTGDSRAVLGRSKNGKWVASALSEDQTGDTESEVKRLQQEHPGEKYVIRHGRVLGGLQPTRAFGDAVYKWSRDVQAKIKSSFFGKSTNPLLRTPPYVTAEPVVTTTEVSPQNGDFVVMASDGLWEMLSNEEVVGLVGRWLENERSKGAGGRQHSWLKSWFSSDSKLPVESPDGQKGDGQRAPIRQQQWDIVGTDRFVVEDANAATHLARNALGGKNRDTVCALLTLVSPYSRRYRDDLTIQVILFGDEVKSGNIAVNPEASASLAKPKAAL